MRRLAVVMTVALALGAAPPWASAEEPPSVIRALDTDDAAALEAARSELVSRQDRDELVAAVLRDPDGFNGLGAPAQTVLVELAGEADLAHVNSALRRIVRDDGTDDGVRRAAVTALGRRGGVADVMALGSVLDAYPDEAARALAEIGGRSAEAVLRKRAGPDAPDAVRAALVRIGDDEPLGSLVMALRTDDEARRAYIGTLLAWATGRELPPESAPWEAYARRRSLASQIGNEDLERAQTAVLELTGVLRSRSASTLEPDLVAILSDPAWHPHARSAAALVLGLGDARGAKDALLHAARNQEHGSVRLYAAEALGRVGDLSVVMPIADMLVHDEDRDRIASRRSPTGVMGEFFPVDPAMMRTMLRLGCPGATASILEVMDGNYRTRMLRDTVRALREVTGGEDFDYEPDAPTEQRLAASARAHAWWAEARDGIGLAPPADDPGWEVFRTHVAAHIAKLGAFKFLHQLRAKKALVLVAEPALPQLLEALSDDDLHVRMGAAEVLHLAGLRAAAPALAERLEAEEHPVARTKQLFALERCGRRTADGDAPAVVRTAVRKALQDRTLEVRIAAARTLGVVGEPDVDAPLLRDLRLAGAGGAEEVRAFRAVTAGALLLLGDASGQGDLVIELLCDDVARRADTADVLRRAGVDLQGYDPDGSPAEREDAVLRIRSVLEEAR